MDDIKKNLGKRIQYLRKSSGLTQEKFAELINIDITSLSKIETGRNYPSPETINKISKCLKLEPYTLFMFENELSSDEYIQAIINNLEIIKRNPEKLKIIYKLSKELI